MKSSNKPAKPREVGSPRSAAAAILSDQGPKSYAATLKRSPLPPVDSQKQPEKSPESGGSVTWSGRSTRPPDVLRIESFATKPSLTKRTIRDDSPAPRAPKRHHESPAPSSPSSASSADSSTSWKPGYSRHASPLKSSFLCFHALMPALSSVPLRLFTKPTHVPESFLQCPSSKKYFQEIVQKQEAEDWTER